MKIGIDGRICDEGGYYGEYICRLIKDFCALRSEDEIIIYRNKWTLTSKNIGAMRHAHQKNISLSRVSLFHESKTKKLFEQEKFSLMIFFDHHVPKGYSGDIYVLIENLTEIFFPKEKWLHRKIYAHKLQRAITKSTKVMTLDSGTALELNERLNIKEDLIERIPGFFPTFETKSALQIQIDIKTKHNIRGEYLIYDSWNEVHNNFERILRTLKKLKDQGIILSLLILCDETTKDIDIRSTALNLWITDQIFFLWAVKADLEYAYYTGSAWVIFSSIYESFPFQFTKALSYNVPIFANDIPANKEVMWEDIHYLDPLSIHNMSDVISWALEQRQLQTWYDKIIDTYNSHASAKRLSEIIEIKK